MDVNQPPLLPVEIPPPSARTIGGFWIRSLAFLIDCLLLGLLGSIAGGFLFDTFARMGAQGRWVGFGVALAYFGCLNSTIGGGRTIGKRMTGLEVVDAAGAPIPPGRSFLRYAVLGMPFMLNGALQDPSLIPHRAGYLIGLVLLCVGGTDLYLFVFNRQTRQSLHDLLTGTSVVRTGGSGRLAARPLAQGHRTAITLGCLLVAVFGVSGKWWMQSGALGDLFSVRQKVLACPEVESAAVVAGRSFAFSNGVARTTSSLDVTTRWKVQPRNREAAAREIAAIVLANYPAIDREDFLSVTVSYGYDIGIAQAWSKESFRHSPGQWTELLSGTAHDPLPSPTDETPEAPPTLRL